MLLSLHLQNVVCKTVWISKAEKENHETLCPAALTVNVPLRTRKATQIKPKTRKREE